MRIENKAVKFVVTVIFAGFLIAPWFVLFSPELEKLGISGMTAGILIWCLAVLLAYQHILKRKP